MEQAVTTYLKYLNIPVSDRYCKKRIASHPDYPSILAVADTLRQFGVSNTVARVNKEKPDELHLPVLLHLEIEGGSLLPVFEPRDLDAAGDKLNHWSGVLIKAEPINEIADKENAKALDDEKRFKFFITNLLLTVSVLVAIPLLISFSWVQLLLIATSMAGVATGYFLFAKDLGITYQAVESFCNAGTGAGCQKVLRSDEGKLFGFITFSDLTLAYFAAQFVSIGLLAPIWTGSALIAVFGWLSFFAVPMIGYSIWLQAFKIKEWCRLCLLVSGIMGLQAIIFGSLFYSELMNPFALVFTEAIMALLLFGLVGSSLLLLEQTIRQKNMAVQNEIHAARIKNSPEVFASLLFKQRKVDTTPFMNEFLIGEPEAPLRLTMVVNLFCTPCKNELEHAKELLSIYREQVSLSLRFLRSRDNGESSDLLLEAWLHELKKLNFVPFHGQQMIEKWYENMDKEKFKDFYPAIGAVSKNETKEYLQTHYSWVAHAGITKTPTTFINGYELPDLYRVGDLFPLVPGLLDIMLTVNAGIEKEATT